MKFRVYIVFLVLSFASVISRAGGPCVPASTSPSCASAVALTVGGACVNGTTCQGAAQAASTCLFTGSECSWYSFVANAPEMVVFVDVTATDGCNISSNVYSSTGPCSGMVQVGCLAGAPLDDTHIFTTLVPGTTYYIQVCYPPGGPCGNDGTAEYCISVAEPDPPCETCATPCGTASGYTSAPSVGTVTADCNTTPFVPELAASSANTFCYSFQATATVVDFNVIITSNCAGGNVSGFSWQLYNASCGAAIQTGTLASLTFTGLTVGNDYVFCYSFTVPGTCTHTQHCPYFVGAIVLPVALTDFDAKAINNRVELSWTTVSELNSASFVVERSVDGINFMALKEIPAAGNSSSTLTYETVDTRPFSGTNYYRLKQVDLDGEVTYSKTISVWSEGVIEKMTLSPNPAVGQLLISFDSGDEEDYNLEVYDATGRQVINEQVTASQGINSFELEVGFLNPGIYHIQLINRDKIIQSRFVKE